MHADVLTSVQSPLTLKWRYDVSQDLGAKSLLRYDLSRVRYRQLMGGKGGGAKEAIPHPYLARRVGNWQRVTP